MAESRRVPFTTLPCNAPKMTMVDKPTLPPQTMVYASPSTALLHGNGYPSEQPPSPEPTVRCVLTLFEPDERTFPQFNYAEILEKKCGPMLVNNGSPSGTFVEEENREKNEVEALARKFEEKYGGGSNYKKDRIQDLVDIGYGYDDDDPFIDNSEAYDEFVPASLTTKYGGFYINSGILQFRQASDEESEDFTIERTTPSSPKKRKLKEGVQDKPKKKQRKEVGQMNSNMGALSENGMEEQMKKKKKKKPPGVLSITDMLKKFQREKEREKLKKEKQALRKMQQMRPTINTPTIHLCPADAAGGGGMGLADPLLSLIGSINENTFIQAASTVDFDIDLDSLLDAANESSREAEVNGDPSDVQEPTQRANQNQTQRANQNQIQTQRANQTQTQTQRANQNQTQRASQNQQPQTENQGGIPQPKSLLPPASEAALILPTQPKTDIQTQSTAISQSQSQPPSKTKASVQQPQLTQPQNLSEPKTISLLQLVPLPEGLPPALERRIGELTVAAKGSVGESKLKFFTTEINSILLDIELQSRELGVQVRSKVYTHLAPFLPCGRETLLKRVKRLLNAHVEQEPMQKLKEAIGRVMPEQIVRFHDNCQAHTQAKISKVTEEGKEREQKRNAGSEDEGEEKSWKRGRRKTFKWNEETRECLCRVVRMKMDRYETEKNESQDVEEFLKTFLDNEVKPLWPKGWMQPRLLLKESRRVFRPPASLPVKKTAKPEKTQPSISGAPTRPSGSSDALTSQGTPPLKQALSLDKDNHLGEGLTHNPRSLAAVEKERDTLKMGEAADTHSPLDLLAEQALARAQLLKDFTSQDLFAAALDSATGDHSRHWSLGADLDSSPPPPPPPQSSPVGLSGNRQCNLAGPSVLWATGHFGLRNGTEMLTMSNDTDAFV